MMYHPQYGGPVGHAHHWVAAVLFIIFAVVALGALAWVVIMMLRQREHHAQLATKAAAGPDPLQILNERFARGEIEPDDYRARRDLLNGE